MGFCGWNVQTQIYTHLLHGSLAEIGPVYEMPPNLDIDPDIGTHCILYPAE
jgi:hypothetical protein